MTFYTITQVIDDRRAVRLCIAAVSLTTDQIAMAVGFDPYDPFADYEVSEEEHDNDKLFEYGLKLSEIVYDEEQIYELYHQQFKSSWSKEEMA